MDGKGETGVPHADVLLPFAEAVLSFDPARLLPARDAVTAAMGEAAMADAAAVVAGFNGITRIADASGIPLDREPLERSESWRGSLGIDDFARAKE